MNKLLLSVFPSIDLFGKAFEQQGFCVVQAQDLIMSGDIRKFNPPSGRFDGLIGGSPCQDFCGLNRNPSSYSQEMLDEYCRVVDMAQPDWFLHENVQGVPTFEIQGYKQQRFNLDLGWFSEFSRLRVFTFGSKNGVLLNPMTSKKSSIKGTCITGDDKRSFAACCEIHGLDKDFNLPSLTLAAKKQAIANGVPLQLGAYVASLIREQYYNTVPLEVTTIERDIRLCACGCGRKLLGRSKTSSDACRKRYSRSKLNTK